MFSERKNTRVSSEKKDGGRALDGDMVVGGNDHDKRGTGSRHDLGDVWRCAGGDERGILLRPMWKNLDYNGGRRCRGFALGFGKMDVELGSG